MDNNLDALRNLYVALGGDADDVADLVTNPDLINAIADLITTKGIAALPTGTSGQVLTMGESGWAAADIPAQLPIVTDSNNGEVLTVVSGDWAAAALPD